LSVVSVVCCQAEVPASGWSLVQRSPNEYGVSECDRESSIMRRPWTTGGLLHDGKIKVPTIKIVTKNNVIIVYPVCNILWKSYWIILYKPTQSSISMTNIHYKLARQTVTQNTITDFPNPVRQFVIKRINQRTAILISTCFHFVLGP